MKLNNRLLAAGLVTVMLLSATGCGAKQEKPQDTSPETENVETEDSLTMTGTLDEVKDFMFVLTDETGTCYSFDFERAPKGLSDVEVGDKITVTYTGTVSQVDPFEGEILSVEEAE